MSMPYQVSMGVKRPNDPWIGGDYNPPANLLTRRAAIPAKSNGWDAIEIERTDCYRIGKDR